MCKLSDYNWMEMTIPHRAKLIIELDHWHEWYLPVRGTVLDAGAGCGETAYFYLQHGANHVICIEPDSEALECLHQNFGKDPRVSIIPKRIDRVKVDIEGSEERMVFETHFPIRLRKYRNPPGRNVVVWTVERK